MKKIYTLTLMASFLLLLSTVAYAQDIGCDEDVYEQSENLTNALLQQRVEAANQLITQPTPVEQATCLDQHTEVIKAAMNGIHSNVEASNTSIAKVVQQPLKETLNQFSSNIGGTISNIISNEFSEIASAFSGLFGGGGGLNVPKTNCDMQQLAWDVAQCIEMPQLPSLSNIVGGRLGELTGAIENAPERFIDQACKGMGGVLGDYMADVNSAFDAVAKDLSKPISDAASAVNDVNDL